MLALLVHISYRDQLPHYRHHHTSAESAAKNGNYSKPSFSATPIVARLLMLQLHLIYNN